MDKRLEDRLAIRLSVNINGIHIGQALDISPEGMFIKVPVEFKVGAVITLRFNLGAAPVQIKSLVRSSRDHFGIGVQFQDVSDAIEDRIIEYIDQVKKKDRESRSAGGQSVVLLVDDAGAVDLFETQLFLAGIDVIRARNGVEAIKKLEEHGGRVDLIITDLLMPVMDGYMLIHYLKTTPKYSHIPIVVLSAFHKGKEAIQRVVRLGISSGNIFMRHSSKVGDFAAAVKRIINESKNR